MSFFFLIGTLGHYWFFLKGFHLTYHARVGDKTYAQPKKSLSSHFNSPPVRQVASCFKDSIRDEGCGCNCMRADLRVRPFITGKMLYNDSSIIWSGWLPESPSNFLELFEKKNQAIKRKSKPFCTSSFISQNSAEAKIWNSWSWTENKPEFGRYKWFQRPFKIMQSSLKPLG